MRASSGSEEGRVPSKIVKPRTQETLPDQVVDGSCDHKVTAEHPKGTGLG